MSFLPILNDKNELIDGSGFHLLSFCKENCLKNRCRDHYEKMRVSATGSYRCPYGMSTYVYQTSEEYIILSGIRIRGYYDKNTPRIKHNDDNPYNPVIEQQVCNSLAREELAGRIEKREQSAREEAYGDILHEARSLNSQIKTAIDSIWDNSADENEINRESLLETLKNTHVCSIMISNRFAYCDSVLNPSLTMGDPYPANIFKKFDKMRKLLRGYKRKNVRISVNSPKQSDYRYRIYSTFEILLFILLENAVKYSPEGQSVEVDFNERDSLLDVSITSCGPYCDENELMHICEKGYRGNNAKGTRESGQGFGLSFAKMICDHHNISMEFKSKYLRKDHGVLYGNFTVILHFDNAAEVR